MIEITITIAREENRIRIQVKGDAYGEIEPEVAPIAEDFMDTLEALAIKHCPTLNCTRKKVC